MFTRYFIVNSFNDAVALSSMYTGSSKIVAGGTDLILEMERGQHKDINEIIDISRVKDLDKITIDEKGLIHVGPLATHSACLNSSLIKDHARCLYEACEKVGSPQIRNRGTVAGNVATASPANDTICALMALNAYIEITSKKGKQIVEIQKFFLGVRKTILNQTDLISDIYFPALNRIAKSVFLKVALRNAQAISIANVSVVLETKSNRITDVRIAMGAVSPTIIRASEAEKFLIGKEPSEENFVKAGEIAELSVNPISDIRASEKYRRNMIAVHVTRALLKASSNEQIDKNKPVLLWGKETTANKSLTENTIEINENTILEVKINGKEYRVKDAFHKSLLDMLRENVLLTGTKEGCGEGECGACTVFMDGVAVLACLIPAPRAHKSEIITIEGLSSNNVLHKIQQSFIDEGAVQCGYCTPGFVMAAAKLLEENERPSIDEIKTGISGNLCRCTGYYKIITAIEKAAER